MSLDNTWSGENKTYTITLVPSQNGKTVNINWAYDADYGWNLIWRYAGLYIHGDPASQIALSLSNIAAMLASFPNVDYKDQKIDVTDVTARPGAAGRDQGQALARGSRRCDRHRGEADRGGR